MMFVHFVAALLRVTMKAMMQLYKQKQRESFLSLLLLLLQKIVFEKNRQASVKIYLSYPVAELKFQKPLLKEH